MYLSHHSYGVQLELKFPDFPTEDEYMTERLQKLNVASYISHLPEGTDLLETIKSLAKFKTNVEMSEFAKKNKTPMKF